MALSINVVLHRHNLDHLGALVDLAADLGAVRIELANTQFHGSALAHADALLPTLDSARARPRGRRRATGRDTARAWT